MQKFILGLFGAIAVLTFSAGQAGAAPILGCPAGKDCNGATVGVELFDLGSGDYRIDVVFDFAGYTGSQSNVLHAVQIKEFTTGSVTNASVEFAGKTSTAFTGWGLVSNELNANGCGGGGGGVERLCAEANDADGAGALVYDKDNYLTATFSFFFTTDGKVDDGLHLKFLYENTAGKKKGDLGSFDIPYTRYTPDPDPDPDPQPDPVPEPVSLALLSAGLLGAGFARRRARR